MTISPWSDVLTPEDRVLTFQLQTWREDAHHHLELRLVPGAQRSEVSVQPELQQPPDAH